MATLKELYVEQNELREKLKKIETEISRKMTEECKEKLDKAFSLLEEVYDIILLRGYHTVSIDCDNCNAIIEVGLDDVMDKMRYTFEHAMKGV